MTLYHHVSTLLNLSAPPATVRLFYGHSALLFFTPPVVTPLIAALAWRGVPAACRSALRSSPNRYPQPVRPTRSSVVLCATPDRRLRYYRCEGPGVVYIVGRVPTAVWNDFVAGRISLAQLQAAFQIKAGHTKHFPTRRRDYKKCASEHKLFWHATYTTSQRMRLGQYLRSYLLVLLT